MAMSKNTEIELKLLLQPSELAKLLTLDVFTQAVRPDSRRERQLVSTYYDTQEMALAAHGIAYRVRDKGDGSFEATVKTSKKSSGGLSERLELNLPIAKAEPVLDGFAALGLGYELSTLAPQGVQALFTVRVKRITYVLQYKSAVIEMAIDKGEITTGTATDSIDEVELELLEGETSDLLAYKELVAGKVSLRAEDRSKFARGLALLQQKRGA